LAEAAVVVVAGFVTDTVDVIGVDLVAAVEEVVETEAGVDDVIGEVLVVDVLDVTETEAGLVDVIGEDLVADAVEIVGFIIETGLVDEIEVGLVAAASEEVKDTIEFTGTYAGGEKCTTESLTQGGVSQGLNSASNTM